MKKPHQIWATPLFALWLLCAGGCAGTQNTKHTNLLLTATDRKAEKTSHQLVFYKIYINDELAAKTPSGKPLDAKLARLTLPEGEYIVFFERWELPEPKNEGANKKRYLRANNIKQMNEPVSIKIINSSKAMKVQFGYDFELKRFYHE